MVEALTAGIVPHQVDIPNNNMIIYDLAGHHQYFSSHSACLESISLNSPAIFLLLQDLRKDPEAMTKEVYYWSTMIDGVCHKCPKQSSVIVVGTHADLLTPEQLTRKLTHLQSVAVFATSHQKLVSIIPLDVRYTYGAEMDKFKALLDETKKNIISMGPYIPFHCHLMFAFIKEKLPRNTGILTFSDLLVNILTDSDSFIQPDIFSITSILNTLSEKGLIVFIQSGDPSYSWIVLHKESILKNVNGTLFADPSNKKCTPIASNTGIVPSAVLNKFFPQYDIEMLIQFMIRFELCQAVDLSQIDTNMAPDGSSNPCLGPFLFFPALVSVCRPSSAEVPINSFGWSMIVSSPEKFFSTRILHVLLHRLPFKFAPPAAQTTPLHSVRNRRCTIWSRGIMWVNETGVTTIVEMSETFQSLSLSIFYPDRTDPNYLNLVHSVVAVIKNACQEFCPHLEVLDVISCPPEASSDHSKDTMLELLSLMDALDNNKRSVSDWKGQKYVEMEKWIRIEPCLPYLVGGKYCMCCKLDCCVNNFLILL